MILHIAVGGHLRKVSFERGRDDGSFVCEIDGKRLAGSVRLLEPGILSLLVGAESYRCVLDAGEEPAIYIDGRRYSFQVEDPRSLKARLIHAAGGSGPRPVKAPMPGRVVRILAEEGAEVEARQGILVIEAMKMQNELKAPRAGRVAKLRAVVGATVNAGEVLAVIE
ncbi:MAG TPA: biotin/lipoyl-containing protein [Acidobacteriaceae bacterium]